MGDRANLAGRGLIKFIVSFIFISLLLFIPAGTIRFSNAWLFLSLLFIPMFLIGLILLYTNPDLLRRRLYSKEKETTQRKVLSFSFILFVMGFVWAGLDFRFGWSSIPFWLYIIATIVFALGYLCYMEVLRENKYLSRTIRIEDNQKVVNTGLYSLIRHPMYLAAILVFLSMPLVLGSIGSFFFFLAFPCIMVMRIKNEEEVLCKELEGYAAYMKKVKYRLIPYVW